MDIQTKAQLEPHLPPDAQKVFTSFANLANKSSLHPFDYERFYAFIWHCHVNGVEIGEGGVQRLLMAVGFTEEKAEYLADVFQNGIDLLRFVANQ